jgi:putative ABC transport system permease protein
LSQTIALTPVDLVIATALVFVAGAVSVLLRLGLERRLAVASVRTLVQLGLLGYVLRWVFGHDTPWPVLVWIAVMIAAAGRAAVARSSRKYGHVHLDAFLTLALTSLATTFTVTGAVVGVQPWYQAQYVIPLLGMVLGNSLTGISLALDHLLESLDAKRELIEAHLALGATRWEAAREPLAEAVRRGMIPIINSMSVVGLVSLPGMMTGQILSGEDPVDAVKYQLVVMFMLAASTSLGCIVIALLAYRRLFDAAHRLRADHINAASS